MRTLILSLAVALSAVSTHQALAQEFKIMTGNQINIEKLKESTQVLSGKSFTSSAPGTLVIVSATWCGPCHRLQQERLPTIKKETGVNIVILKTGGSDLASASEGIDADSYDVVFANEGPAVDEIANRVRGYPTIFVFDSNLKLVGEHLGGGLTSEIVLEKLQQKAN